MTVQIQDADLYEDVVQSLEDSGYARQQAEDVAKVTERDTFTAWFGAAVERIRKMPAKPAPAPGPTTMLNERLTEANGGEPLKTPAKKKLAQPGPPTFERTCANPNCKKTFSTTDNRKTTCCKECSSIASYQRRKAQGKPLRGQDFFPKVGRPRKPAPALPPELPAPPQHRIAIQVNEKQLDKILLQMPLKHKATAVEQYLQEVDA